MIFTFRLSNSGLSFAMVPSSVVHTGVKSFGCENKTPRIAEPFVEIDPAFGGVGVEIGRGIADAQGHGSLRLGTLQRFPA